MRKQTWAAVFIFGVLGLKGQTETAPRAPEIKFEKYTLPNGLQVILHVDRKIPMVHVNQWFHVGSADEVTGRTGFAHLFEHMMFQGSKNADKYLSVVETMGANIFEGAVNGTTSFDRTNYFTTVPTGSLESLLWLESDRVATLPEGLTKEKLDNQRDVVKNERRQGLENVPYNKAYPLIFENLFPPRHPYSHDVIGSHADLTAASMDDVKEFFRRYYVPNNLSLTITGDFDPAQAKQLIEKYYGPIPPGPPLDRPVRWLPKLNGEKVVDTTDRVAQERVYFNWPTPAFFDKGDAELDLLSTILTDGITSRLNRALIYDKQLCSDVVSYQQSLERSSVFTVYATVRTGVPLTQVEEIVKAEITRLAKEGPTNAELDRSKAKWEYGYISGLERIGGFGGKADFLNEYNVYLGDPNRFQADLDRHHNVTIAQIRDTASQWLDTPNRLVIRVHPEVAGRESTTAIDRSKRPTPQPDRSFELPKVLSDKLPNGMDVLVVERHDLPKVAVTLVSRAGKVDEAAGKDGLADFVADTMKYGTTSRSAVQIEEGLAALGTSVNGFGGVEQSSIGFEVLKPGLRPALAIFSDVVLHASFPQAEFDREQKLRVDALQQESKDADALSRRIGPGLVFGADHPYGRVRRGLPSTIGGMTREDLAQFHQRYWKPGSSALILAGDITLAEALAAAKDFFGSWSGGAAQSPVIPPVEAKQKARVYVVDRQDAAQSLILQALPAIPRSSEDYYALELVDTIWGHGFKTRLNMNLREDKGYSYGVFSAASAFGKGGSWVAFGGVQTDKTKESLAEFRKELNGLAGDKPVTEAELKDAKAFRIRAYAQQFETVDRISNQIADLWTLGLPMTELAREPRELEKLTLQQVNAVAQKYARPAQCALLVVGDRQKIEKGMQELDLGPVTYLDVEGKPITR